MYELQNLLGEELFKSVEKKLGDVKLIADDGKLIPKHRFDCVNVSLKEHKEALNAMAEENAKLKLCQKNAVAEAELLKKVKSENAALVQLLSCLLPYKLEAETKETNNE